MKRVRLKVDGRFESTQKYLKYSTLGSCQNKPSTKSTLVGSCLNFPLTVVLSVDGLALQQRSILHTLNTDAKRTMRAAEAASLKKKINDWQSASLSLPPVELEIVGGPQEERGMNRNCNLI